MIAQLDKYYLKARFSKVIARLIAYLFFEGRPLTTRGRWFNFFVFLNYRIIVRFFPKNSDVSPVYILGTGRSGSTILGLILSLHKNISFLNEPKAMWHFINKNEDINGNYTNENANYRLMEESFDQQGKKHLNSIYSFFLKVTSSQVVVDKYPELIYRIPYVNALFPGAKYIFLTRDGRSTCNSIDYWSDRLGTINNNDSVHDWWGVDRRKWLLLVEQIIPDHPDLCLYQEEMKNWKDHRLMAAVEWIVTMREGVESMNKHPDRILHVRYEDLCSNQQLVTDEILQFLELPKSVDLSNYAASVLKEGGNYDELSLPHFLIKPFNDMQYLLGYNSVQVN